MNDKEGRWKDLRGHAKKYVTRERKAETYFRYKALQKRLEWVFLSTDALRNAHAKFTTLYLPTMQYLVIIKPLLSFLFNYDLDGIILHDCFFS